MAGLTRWDPFADVVSLQEQMNRLFEDRMGRTRRSETTLSNFAPAVDIFEDAEGITVSAELPGVDPKEVEVKVEDGALTISGHRKLEREDKKEGYHRIERSYGSFMRSFTLPPTVDVEKIRAENRNGLLKVFLPRKEETKPKKISVKIEQ